MNFTGTRPKSLYLGQKQFDILAKKCNGMSDFVNMSAFPSDESRRVEYRGLKVYLVDSQDYLECV
jgi:hypothetical protein